MQQRRALLRFFIASLFTFNFVCTDQAIAQNKGNAPSFTQEDFKRVNTLVQQEYVRRGLTQDPTLKLPTGLSDTDFTRGCHPAVWKFLYTKNKKDADFRTAFEQNKVKKPAPATSCEKQAITKASKQIMTAMSGGTGGILGAIQQQVMRFANSALDNAINSANSAVCTTANDINNAVTQCTTLAPDLSGGANVSGCPVNCQAINASLNLPNLQAGLCTPSSGITGIGAGNTTNSSNNTNTSASTGVAACNGANAPAWCSSSVYVGCAQNGAAGNNLCTIYCTTDSTAPWCGSMTSNVTGVPAAAAVKSKPATTPSTIFNKF